MSSILCEVKEQVARITLNRPDKLNSFNREMAMRMQEALDRCREVDVRCVVIMGAGKGFSAGQDLAEVTDPNGPNIHTILHEHYNPIILRIRNLEKPVIAAVNGVAAGAGANIALACDVVIASENASFLQAFSKIGLIPDSGGTHTLPRLIGWQKASALMMLGEKISATEAERIGMVYKIFPEDRFEENIQSMSRTLANLPTRGLWLTKRALSASFAHTLEDQLALEDQLQQEAAATSDYREGVTAFMEKRTAVFKGK